MTQAQKNGYFGEYGGRFVGETLMPPLLALEDAYGRLKNDEGFKAELAAHLKNFVGRPTALTQAKNLSASLGGAQIYLKREDLAHTGAHKINNSMGQALLAKHMGKTTLIAETGAGQHGVATATAASFFGLKCVVFMGAADMARQHLNVVRMQVLGAKVVAVHSGAKTLKDATSAAMRHWVAVQDTAHYIIGSALGPHPYPTIVRDFQKIIGVEARAQMLAACGTLPNYLVACVGGGSNAIGLFHPFLDDASVQMVGVEAGGHSITPTQHAARFADNGGGRLGIFHGTKSIYLQDPDGQILETHSVSAGLDYPGIGPEHAFLRSISRASYAHVGDAEAMQAALKLAQTEGIIPALESAHAVAYALTLAPTLPQNQIILVGLSGRGDKDIQTYTSFLEG